MYLNTKHSQTLDKVVRVLTFHQLMYLNTLYLSIPKKYLVYLNTPKEFLNTLINTQMYLTIILFQYCSTLRIRTNSTALKTQHTSAGE